jgi:Caspase domain
MATSCAAKRTVERGVAALVVLLVCVAAAAQPAPRAAEDDRAQLQSQIRARAQARAQRLIGEAPTATPPAVVERAPTASAAVEPPPNRPPAAPRSTPCWTARLQNALADCRRELAERGDDAALHERIGDLLRSLGQGRDALAAYQRSAALGGTDKARLPQKIGALNAVLGAAPAPTLPEVAAPAVTPALPPSPGKFHALVIGNNRYRAFTPLLTAVADARLVGDLLRGQYGFEVETLENASRQDIIQAMSRLRRVTTEADRVLIYYAGHGIRDEKTGRGYWLPVDAQADNIANWVSSNDISDLAAAMPARHALIVADSCFSGALTRAGLGIALDERTGVLQRLIAKRSRTVLTSGGLEPVLDAGAGQHSIFARAFVDTLAENKEPLEAARLFVELRARVVRAAEQTPQYAQLHDAGHDGGDFVFVPSGSRKALNAAPR